jgi:hypothetical protein
MNWFMEDLHEPHLAIVRGCGITFPRHGGSSLELIRFSKTNMMDNGDDSTWQQP